MKKWRKLTPESLPVVYQWNCVDMSEDGRYIVVSAKTTTGSITHMSADFGLTFEQLPTPNFNSANIINDYALPADLNRRMMAVSDAGILTTTNYGVTWLSINPTIKYVSLAIAKGSARYQCAVGASPPSIQRSTDYGVTFTAITNPNASEDYSLSKIALGSYATSILLFSDYGVGLYKSTNSGSSWSSVTISGCLGNNFVDVTSNEAGTYMLALEESCGLYKSTDTGATFLNITPDIASVDETWKVCSMSDDGQTIAVVGHNTEDLVYVSRNGGTTWTIETPEDFQAGKAKIDDVRVSGLGKKILFGYSNTDSSTYNFVWLLDYYYEDEMYEWKELQPIGDVTNDWFHVLLAESGNFIMVHEEFYPAKISEDGGITWRDSYDQDYGDGSTEFSSIDTKITPSGEYMIGAGDNGAYGTVVSNNKGSTWSIWNMNDLIWDIRAVALSSTGDKMYAALTYGVEDDVFGIFKSTDYGTSWSEITKPVADAGYRAFHMDCDYSGNNILFTFDKVNAYVSTNGATSWTGPITVASGITFKEIYDCSVSSTGQYMVLLDMFHGIILSSDYGTTWNKKIIDFANTTGEEFIACDISADGSTIAMCYESYNGYENVAISYDYGETWVNATPYQTPTYSYPTDIAVSNDGKHFLVCYQYGGRVYYMGSTEEEPPTPVYYTYIKSIGKILLADILSVNETTILGLKSIAKISNEGDFPT